MIWRNWSASRLRDPEAMWHSKTVMDIATQNSAGVNDPEIDALIESQKQEMDLAKRNEILKKIDERLTAIVPYVLLWQSDRQKLLYWNKFGTPKYVLNKYDREDAAAVYWWFDPDKAQALNEARRNDAALPALPARVEYAE
jgi:microcin C transport system substrate-binding protein